MRFEIFNIHNPEDYKKYYPIVKKWWKDWDWSPIEKEFLSTTGVIVKNQDEYICAGWLYKTDSLMSVIDFFISSKKKYSGNLRKKALKFLIEQLERLAKKQGFIAVYTSIKNNSLINTMLSMGYGKDSVDGQGDRDMTVFIKLI